MNAIQLRRMILDAAEHVPFYRRHWKQAGVDLTRIGSAVHLEFLPTVRKEDLLACPPEDRLDHRYLIQPTHADAASESIGQPVEVPADKRTLRRQRARFLRALAEVGHSLADRVMLIAAPPSPSGALFLRWTCVDPRVDEDALFVKFAKARPHVLHGPLSSLMAIAQRVITSSEVTWRPRVVVSTAEALTDAKRALLEAAFGTTIADFYGTPELGLLAYSKPGMTGYQFMTSEFHVEVLPAVVGQRGGPERLVVTDLIAGAMPLIRFDTGDLVRREAPRPGVLTAPPVVGIVGREAEGRLAGSDTPALVHAPAPREPERARIVQPAWNRSLYVFRPAAAP